jgi:very-short-patch-repair endonuclease
MEELHGCHAQPPKPLDRAVARLAQRQHGVVSRAQLFAIGFGRGAVEWRVRNGRLHRIHQGVYAVGHTRLPLRGRYWAALLACGGPQVAVLSHRAAAALWDLLPPPSGKLDVTTRGTSRSTSAIRVHHSPSLAPADVADIGDGLAVTTVARTLVDLADVLTAHQLTRACHRAEHLRLLHAPSITPLTGRRSRALTTALAELAVHAPHITRSELEERFLALLAAAALPRPRVNARVAGHEVDFLWPAERLVAETDGAATHLTTAAFEHDRRRDAALLLAGYRVVRFTWRQVTQEPWATAETLRALLRP